MLTLGLQEWFIILTDGNIPEATVTENSGNVSWLEKFQCSITLALHDIWHICLIRKPPIVSTTCTLWITVCISSKNVVHCFKYVTVLLANYKLFIHVIIQKFSTDWWYIIPEP